ncbi:hypothetical protein [Cronobacter phage vB_Cdu_VP8]|nr:hypothetical protein [Cronobacter phage vB_Cdu_VP8]
MSDYTEPSALASFRRSRELARQKENETLPTKPDTYLDDLVEASELIADRVEDNTNRTIAAQEDGNAASELVAENTETLTKQNVEGNQHLSNIADTARQISSKLSEFADLLNQKLEASVQSGLPAIGNQSTAIQAIEEQINTPVDEELLADAIKKLLPMPVVSETELFPQPEKPADQPKPDPETKREDERKEKEKSQASEKILSAVKGGFKSTYGLLNNIAGSLFKYTITAAANMLKWAGIMFAIVFAVDLIRVHFKYWQKVFEKSLDELNEQVGAWGPILTDIFNTAQEMRDYWAKGQYGDLVASLVQGLGRTLLDLGHMIMYGIGKAIASVLDTIPGMSDTAKKVEGRAIRTYSEQTGYVPTEEEREKVIAVEKYDQGEQYKDLKAEAQKYTEDQFVKKTTNRGFLNDGIALNETQARQIHKDIRSGKLKDADIEKEIGIQADLAMRMNTIENRVQRTNGSPSTNAELMDNLSKLARDIGNADIQSYMKEPLQERVQKMESALAERTKPKVTPKPASESAEATQVKEVEASIKPKETAQIQAGTTLNNINNVKNSKTVVQVQPRTNIPSNGIMPQRSLV